MEVMISIQDGTAGSTYRLSLNLNESRSIDGRQGKRKLKKRGKIKRRTGKKGKSPFMLMGIYDEFPESFLDTNLSWRTSFLFCSFLPIRQTFHNLYLGKSFPITFVLSWQLFFSLKSGWSQYLWLLYAQSFSIISRRCLTFYVFDGKKRTIATHLWEYLCHSKTKTDILKKDTILQNMNEWIHYAIDDSLLASGRFTE